MHRLEEWPSSTEFGLQAACNVAPALPQGSRGHHFPGRSAEPLNLVSRNQITDASGGVTIPAWTSSSSICFSYWPKHSLEFLIELAGEATFSLLLLQTREVFVVSREVNPVLAALGYVLLGMATGGVSVFLFPHPLIHPSRIHGISLLVSPVLTGLVMSRIGAALRRYGKHPTQIESFGYGFAFAFGMALVRYLVVK